MVEAVHLVKRFSGVTVVNDVSFELRPGEVVGYLGPNGSGKTTTTRMLTGLLEPTSGRILVDGRRIDEDLPAFHRRLGYVPEEPHLYQFSQGASIWSWSVHCASWIVSWVLLGALNRRTPADPGILDPDTAPAGATQALVLND